VLGRSERLARQFWPPLFLCALVLVTWVVVNAVGGVVYSNTAAIMFINLIVVMGLQIFSGNSGVLSFGHIAFMAAGAYFSALLTIPTAIKQFTFLTMPHFLSSWIFPAQLNALEGTLAGAGFAMLLALLFAPPIVRLAGVQAGIGTLAVLVIVYVFDSQTTAVTRGESTMIGVPTTTTFRAVMIWAMIAIVVAFVFQQSRRGLRLRASRENERAARSVGVNVSLERAIAFVLSGFVVGIGGALYAHYITAFSPESFYFDITFLTIAMLVVGGSASVTGAVIGCYFITVVNELFRRFEVNGWVGVHPPSGTANLVLALVLLVTLILRPRGITGGKEIPWPTDWRFGLPGKRGAGGVVMPVSTAPPVPETIGAEPAGESSPQAESS
jgi:branched-chain amino acid transport system permease protein